MIIDRPLQLEIQPGITDRSITVAKLRPGLDCLFPVGACRPSTKSTTTCSDRTGWKSGSGYKVSVHDLPPTLNSNRSITQTDWEKERTYEHKKKNSPAHTQGFLPILHPLSSPKAIHPSIQPSIHTYIQGVCSTSFSFRQQIALLEDSPASNSPSNPNKPNRLDSTELPKKTHCNNRSKNGNHQPSLFLDHRFGPTIGHRDHHTLLAIRSIVS